MTNYRKYLKNVKPEEFIEALNKRTQEYENSITENKKKRFKLKKKQLKAKNLSEMKQLEDDIFWTDYFISEDKKKLSLINDVLQQLGWSVGYKREWKERVE